VADAIRIAIVEPQPLLRQGMVLALTRAGFAVVAEGQNFDDVARIVRQDERPNILVVDIAMPGKPAEAIASALRVRAGLKIIALTPNEGSADTVNAVRMGVSGLVRKTASGHELIALLQAAHRGEPYVSPNANLFTRHHKRRRAMVEGTGNAESLFLPREINILGLLNKGLTNQEIAKILGLHIRTIKIHITRIFRKLGVRNRVEAVIAAKKRDLSVDLPAERR
jgi:two-component system, NarL family, nitrate/nitrite response regulator NarL